jgi:hypothetical protein
MNALRPTLITALFVFAAGCGGSVSQSEGSGGAAGGGSGGAGAVGGSGGAITGGTGGGGVGGAGGVVTGGSGGVAGGTVACGRQSAGLDVTIEPDNAFTGPTCSPADATPTVWQQTGQVVKTSKNTFVLDTCPPNADCIAMLTTVSIDAQGLELWLPQDAYVSLKYELMPAWGGCTTRITIQNEPTWGGLPNPVSGGTDLYLVGTDGVVDHPDAPFDVTEIPLGCVNEGPGCGGPTPDDYALDFSVGPGAPPNLVGMGTTVIMDTPQQPFWVHNLRSYQSGACDDYWNWAWYAAWIPTSALPD